MKLSDELKKEIFKEFSFKFITSSSSTTKIIKEIYNTYFNKVIITTFYDDNKHVHYTIDDSVHEYYNFAKDNLILDSLTYVTYRQLEESNDELIEI